jgi:hypothetical protein
MHENGIIHSVSYFYDARLHSDHVLAVIKYMSPYHDQSSPGSHELPPLIRQAPKHSAPQLAGGEREWS